MRPLPQKNRNSLTLAKRAHSPCLAPGRESVARAIAKARQRARRRQAHLDSKSRGAKALESTPKKKKAAIRYDTSKEEGRL